jgi:hypothetical protein
MKITEEQLAALLKKMELEEPSMSFTRNLMDQIDLEIAPVSLKTKVDRRVIIAITTVFILAMGFVCSYALINNNITYTLPRLDLNLQIDTLLSSTLLKAFLFIDLILGLLYFDSLLRRKKA